MYVSDQYRGTLAAALHIAIEVWTEDEAAARQADPDHAPIANQFALQIDQARELRDAAEA